MSCSAKRKISFPADSVLTAVIQDGDMQELLHIICHKRSEVNINQENHVGLTALHQGVLSNNIDAVKLLLGSGSDVNAQDIHGFSPLHAACACGFLQLASLLILFGADVFSLTKQREYPVDVAKDVTVIRMLQREMCDRIQKDVYYQSYLTYKAFQLWSLMKKIVHLLFRTSVYVFKKLKQSKIKDE